MALCALPPELLAQTLLLAGAPAFGALCASGPAGRDAAHAARAHMRIALLARRERGVGYYWLGDKLAAR
jgi:hypothetical protein